MDDVQLQELDELRSEVGYWLDQLTDDWNTVDQSKLDEPFSRRSEALSTLAGCGYVEWQFGIRVIDNEAPDDEQRALVVQFEGTGEGFLSYDNVQSPAVNRWKVAFRKPVPDCDGAWHCSGRPTVVHSHGLVSLEPPISLRLTHSGMQAKERYGDQNQVTGTTAQILNAPAAEMRLSIVGEYQPGNRIGDISRNDDGSISDTLPEPTPIEVLTCLGHCINHQEAARASRSTADIETASTWWFRLALTLDDSSDDRFDPLRELLKKKYDEAEQMRLSGMKPPESFPTPLLPLFQKRLEDLQALILGELDTDNVSKAPKSSKGVTLLDVALAMNDDGCGGDHDRVSATGTRKRWQNSRQHPLPEKIGISADGKSALYALSSILDFVKNFERLDDARIAHVRKSLRSKLQDVATY